MKKETLIMGKGIIIRGKGQGKLHTRTGYEVPEGE